MTKLEMNYLMNVALYFETKKDIQSFLLVSKKAKSSIMTLKTNPPLFKNITDKEYNDIEWFLTHFEIETLNMYFNSRSIPIQLIKKVDSIINYNVSNTNL